MSSVVPNTPLRGFEQRLLTELRAQVATQQVAASAQPAAASAQAAPTVAGRRRLGMRRVTLPLAAAVTALVTGLLTLLPAATPALARAFPILAGPTHALPSRLARALRAQWASGTGPSFDMRHAYAFRTFAGTGYVIVDRSARWLCILVPGFSSNAAGGRCERITLARLGRPPLTVRLSGSSHSQVVVALLPRGATASVQSSAGRPRRLTLHSGVLAVMSRGPVTVTTMVTGQNRVRHTYMP